MRLCHASVFIKFSRRHTKAVYASLQLTNVAGTNASLLARVVDTLHHIVTPNCADRYALAALLSELRMLPDDAAVLRWVLEWERRRDELWWAYTSRDAEALGQLVLQHQHQHQSILFALQDDGTYETVFHRAVRDEYLPCLALLSGPGTAGALYHGLNQRSAFDDTPMDLAARQLSVAALKHLALAPGARLDAPNAAGRTPLHLLFIALGQRWAAQRAVARRALPAGAWLQHRQLFPAAAATPSLRPAPSDVVASVADALRSIPAPAVLTARDHYGFSICDLAAAVGDARVIAPLLRHTRAHLDSAVQPGAAAAAAAAVAGLVRAAVLADCVETLDATLALLLHAQVRHTHTRIHLSCTYISVPWRCCCTRSRPPWTRSSCRRPQATPATALPARPRPARPAAAPPPPMPGLGLRCRPQRQGVPGPICWCWP